MKLAILAVMLAFAGGAQAAPLAAGVSGPKISVEPEAFDFGKALQNKELKKEFVIRNIGTEDLVIERVTTTCGCTVVDGYAKLVKPGQSTNMEVRLQTRTFKGDVQRKILVRSNDVTRDPLELKVQVNVVAQ